jgi:hypothetical protein
MDFFENIKNDLPAGIVVHANSKVLTDGTKSKIYSL